MKSSLLAFFLIISSSVFSQEIIIGPQLYMNSTTFKVDGTTLFNPGFATAHSTLTGGLGYTKQNITNNNYLNATQKQALLPLVDSIAVFVTNM
jgi:hypothetical protein